MTKADIIVIIPIYKEIPDANELYSLRQCVQVLSAYKLMLVTPEGLDVSRYMTIAPDVECETFEPVYFKNIAGYNKLMMSAFFYKAFRDYSYILVYQLDAWVFRDELLDWCKKGYDYIGAPWLVAPPVTKDKVIINFSKRMVGHVGNGGFSLRKVSTMIFVCRLFSILFWFFPKNEDLFWGYLIDKIYPFFKKPGVDEALKFAFESVPRKAFEKNGRKLPFGCHAWEKYEPESGQNLFQQGIICKLMKIKNIPDHYMLLKGKGLGLIDKIRLHTRKRHIPFRLSFFGKTIEVMDAGSFLAMYTEIFLHQNYRFKAGDRHRK